MKISAFRKLIREEVKKVLKESIIGDLAVDKSVYKKLGVSGENEGMLDSVQSSHQTKLLKRLRGTEGVVEIYQIVGTPYIVTDEEGGFGDIFLKSDMQKIVASVKDGSFFDFDV